MIPIPILKGITFVIRNPPQAATAMIMTVNVSMTYKLMTKSMKIKKEEEK